MDATNVHSFPTGTAADPFQEAGPYTAPLATEASSAAPAARSNTSTMLIVGSVVGAVASVGVAWWGYRAWKRRRAQAQELLQKSTGPRPVPAQAANAA